MASRTDEGVIGGIPNVLPDRWGLAVLTSCYLVTAVTFLADEVRLTQPTPVAMYLHLYETGLGVPLLVLRGAACGGGGAARATAARTAGTPPLSLLFRAALGAGSAGTAFIPLLFVVAFSTGAAGTAFLFFLFMTAATAAAFLPLLFVTAAARLGLAAGALG